MLCSLLGKQNVVPRPEDKDHLRILYFQAGLQYQIAGRFSAIAWFSPVSGNLLHHAIEFYLKGALIKTLDERARRKIGHDVGNALSTLRRLSGWNVHRFNTIELIRMARSGDPLDPERVPMTHVISRTTGLSHGIRLGWLAGARY
jgi:hypothetical protein